MDTRLGQLSVSYSAKGIPKYSLELWHDGLKKHRLIRGDTDSVVRLKAQLQVDEWERRWAIVDASDQERSRKAAGKQRLEERKAEAAQLTFQAQKELDALDSLLKATLAIDDRVDWASLKAVAPFPEPEPKKAVAPFEPVLGELPREPQPHDPRYQPSLGIFDRLISSRKERILNEKRKLFESDFKQWEHKLQQKKIAYSQQVIEHRKIIAELAQSHEKALDEWSRRKLSFESKQASGNADIDAKRASYENRDSSAIVEYCDLVLSSSRYPECFPQEFDLQYEESAGTLIVDYQLPCPDDLPKLKGVKHVSSTDKFEKQLISDAQASKQYDDVLYQVALRTVHELFEADAAGALDAVVFNGIVTSVDRTTGKPATACVLSVRANKAEFMEINLALVDPKSCFKSLKGVGSSKLHGLSPVPPIMPLNRADGRFVSAYEVTNTLDGSVNLAAMDWEDFEHLIREVFEKEFSVTGGEVRVTQASRDGGVDAIAFDPDPIRGGKIVIQAKRYTNTVGVGAVRDLYGTVLNEGATKGVLVTTSDYGPDSYAFANGKPLVLLSGANLLHMLAKHGHSARIDLHEAKKLVAARP
jgi:restriction system protein